MIDRVGPVPRPSREESLIGWAADYMAIGVLVALAILLVRTVRYPAVVAPGGLVRAWAGRPAVRK